MQFELSSFLSYPPSDLFYYWTDELLPHPGCPQSFEIVVASVYALHDIRRLTLDAMPDISSIDKQQNKRRELLLRRELAFKQLKAAKCILETPLDFRPTLPDDLDWTAIYFPYKDHYLIVPLDEKYTTDFDLVRLILSGSIT